MLFCTTYLQFCSRTFFVIFEYFCHPHPLFVLSTVPSCKDIQIPHDFRVEINDVSTKPFLKQTLSHSSSVLKLTLVDGPSWQNNFGDGALNQYKGVSRDKSVSSRYKSVFTRTPVSDSFGCFWNVRITVKWYERLQIEGSQPIQTMSIHFVSNWSAVASLSPATGLLVSFHPGYSWSFGARTFLGGSNVFSQQRPKINAVSGKNQKKEHQEGIGIYGIKWYTYIYYIYLYKL